LSHFISIVLITEWSLHTHSEHWQHFQSVFLSVSVVQTEHVPWVQNGPVGIDNNTYHM